MLVLTRRESQVILLDTPAGTIRLTVQRIKGASVKLGIAAPAAVRIHREEIHARPRPSLAASFTEGCHATAVTAQ